MSGAPADAAPARGAGGPPLDRGAAELRARIARLEAAHPPTARLALDLAGLSIDVASNSPALVGGLASYFRELRRDPARGPAAVEVLALDAPLELPPGAYQEGERLPGKAPKERFLDLPGGRVVHKVRTGMGFFMAYDSPARNLAVGPCSANEPQVVNFVNNRFIQARLWEGSLLAHAAAVAWEGRGLAITGFAGRGKSTLSLHLMSRGVDFVSNDRLLIREEGASLRCDGVAKHPRVNPGTVLGNPDLHRILAPDARARFEALDPEALWQLEHKYDAVIHDCFGPGRFPMTARLDALLVLHWERALGEPPRFEEVDLAQRRDLLPAIMKPPGLFFVPRPGQPRWPPAEDDYVELLARTRVFEVTGGIDFERGAERCLELLGAPGAPRGGGAG